MMISDFNKFYIPTQITTEGIVIMQYLHQTAKPNKPTTKNMNIKHHVKQKTRPRKEVTQVD